MIDVHCHLNFQAFQDDRDTVMRRAFDAGVTKIINVGTQVSSSIAALDLADTYENLYAIVGVHPHHADKLTAGHPERSEGSFEQDTTRFFANAQNDNKIWLEQLEQMTKHPKVLAIGEIGLDYYSYKSNGIVDPKIQKHVFEAQIDLAYTVKLPLQIHNRHAGEDVIKILKANRNKLLTAPGMFHCFAATRQVLRDALSLGFCIGFDGNITYKGLAPGETVELKELARLTPLDRIVIETDSPYLTPTPHRGKRNEPQYAIIVAEFIASLKDIPVRELIEQTDRNVYTMFERIKAHRK